MLARTLGFITGVFFAASAFAGAWVLPQGEGLFIANATYYTTNHYFDENGHLQSQPRFNKYELQPYVEYGFNDRFTVGGSFYADAVGQSGNHNTGIADPEVFVRGKLWSDDRQVLSIQPLIKLPSYYSESKSPRAGSRSTDAEISLLYGRNQPIFKPEDYVDFRVGYRLRNRGMSDQLRFDAASGIKWNEHIEIVPAVRGAIALSPDDSVAYSENGELDYSLVKAEVKGIYHLNGAQWVEAGLSKPVYGFQTGSGYALTLGYARRF